MDLEACRLKALDRRGCNCIVQVAAGHVAAVLQFRAERQEASEEAKVGLDAVDSWVWLSGLD